MGIDEENSIFEKQSDIILEINDLVGKRKQLLILNMKINNYNRGNKDW